MFSDSLTTIKAQGADLLNDAKTFLTAVATKVAGDVQTDLPTVSTEAVNEALSFVSNSIAQSFIKDLVNSSNLVPAADAAVAAAIGAGLHRINAVIASIPAGA